MAGTVVWFTGPSAAGKTTLAAACAAALRRLRLRAAVLDGDALRAERWPGLGHGPADRRTMAVRTARLAGRRAAEGAVVLVAVIAPLRADRRAARRALGGTRLHEVHVTAPLAERCRRDPKGLYARAAAGGIRGLPGWDGPYEPPLRPALRVDTGRWAVARSVRQVLALAGVRG